MDLRGDDQQRDEIKSELGHGSNLLHQLGHIVAGRDRGHKPDPAVLLVLVLSQITSAEKGDGVVSNSPSGIKGTGIKPD